MRGYVGGFLKEAPQELFPEFSDKKRAKNMCRCTHQRFPQKAEWAGKGWENALLSGIFAGLPLNSFIFS